MNSTEHNVAKNITSAHLQIRRELNQSPVGPMGPSHPWRHRTAEYEGLGTTLNLKNTLKNNVSKNITKTFCQKIWFLVSQHA